jgi:hypothetical protein
VGGGQKPGAGRPATDVERLVNAVAAGTEEDPRWSALLQVLSAAARGAAVDPEREQAAVIAYRAAKAAGPTRRQRARRRRRSRRSVRALAGGLAAVFALCGVAVAAVAAGSGVLPDRGHAAHGGPPPAPRTVPRAAPAPTGSAPAGAHRPAPRTPAATGRPPAHPWTAVPPRDRPPVTARRLCRVYLAAVRDGRMPAAQLTARLQREAGSSHRIAAYCRARAAGAPVP